MHDPSRLGVSGSVEGRAGLGASGVVWRGGDRSRHPGGAGEPERGANRSRPAPDLHGRRFDAAGATSRRSTRTPNVRRHGLSVARSSGSQQPARRQEPMSVALLVANGDSGDQRQRQVPSLPAPGQSCSGECRSGPLGHTARVGGAGRIEELEQLRDLLRDHFALCVQQGMDPEAGRGWGEGVDSYDSLIVRHAEDAGVVGLPPQPWRTNRERTAADEIRRRAGIVPDPPLVSDVQPHARDA